MIYPEELTPVLSEVLSLIVYETAPIARLMRYHGYVIARKVEFEHAAVLHWLIKLVLVEGKEWPALADAQVAKWRRSAPLLAFYFKIRPV